MFKSKTVSIYATFVIIATCFILFNLISFSLNKNYEIQVQHSRDRGIIYDRNMQPIAINIPAYTIYLDKNVLINGVTEEKINSDLQNIANYIVPILNVDRARINELLISEQRTIKLKELVSSDDYKKIINIKEKYNLNSLYGVLDNRRIYPDNDTFSHTVGYLDRTGTSGYSYIEAEYQHLLADYQNGAKSLVLTLDKDIQSIVRNELLKTVADSSVQLATVIIQDVDTGRILASYSYPQFNPNHPFDYSAEERNNKAVMAAIYPGSTMKIFTLMAALEAGKVSLDERFRCDGVYEYSEHTRIRCDHSRSITSVLATDILKYSCNTAIITIAERLDNKYFYDYLKRFGFGEKTGIDITTKEWPAIYHPVNKWHRFSKGYLSLGYDLNVTPMQLINAYSIMVNGGIDITPFMVEKVIYSDGQEVSLHTNDNRDQIIEKKFSETAKFLLSKGVEIGSTGQSANIESIGAIGKTGTASLQILPIVEDEQKTAAQNEADNVEKFYNHSIFVGAIPADNPKVSILATLSGPKINARSGGKLAAPLFKTIAMQIIPYLDIIDADVYNISVNDFSYILPEIENVSDDVMPNLVQKSLRDSLNLLSYFVENLNININFTGQGYVQKQYPPAGTVLTNNQTVELILSYPSINRNESS